MPQERKFLEKVNQVTLPALAHVSWPDGEMPSGWAQEIKHTREPDNYPDHVARIGAEIDATAQYLISRQMQTASNANSTVTSAYYVRAAFAQGANTAGLTFAMDLGVVGQAFAVKSGVEENQAPTLILQEAERAIKEQVLSHLRLGPLAVSEKSAWWRRRLHAFLKIYYDRDPRAGVPFTAVWRAYVAANPSDEDTAKRNGRVWPNSATGAKEISNWVKARPQ